MLDTLLINIALFAERTNWQRLGDNFRSTPGSVDEYKLIAVVAIVVVFAVGLVLLSRFAEPQDRRKSYNSPGELFRDLCRKHHLDRADRRILKRLASAWGLAGPSYLFIDPDYFDVTGLSDEWEENAPRVARIRKRLFGESV